MVTKRALGQIGRFLPKMVSPEKLFRIYQQGYRVNEALRSSHHVEIPIQVWMRQLLTRALDEEPSPRLLADAIGIIVSARSANAVPFSDARMVISKLSKEGVKLGIISNVSSHEVALGILRKVGLRKYFQLVITSALTGIRKPDPAIFLYALMQLKLRPTQAVHVGDSEKHDVEGGSIAGLRTVLISRGLNQEKTLADYRFRSLTEASETLQSL
jgi:HAD superfamily hydrolase (TIGR01509 family)